MPRGGYRPGAGAPLGNENAKRKAGGSSAKVIPLNQSEVQKLVGAGDLMPLEFLMGVMKNPGNLTETRLKAAALLLPYFHPRVAPHRIGKKEAELAAAYAVSSKSKFGPRWPTPTKPPQNIAEDANEWGDDLQWVGPIPPSTSGGHDDN